MDKENTNEFQAELQQDLDAENRAEEMTPMYPREINVLGDSAKSDLMVVLSFVERWNKQDEERNVAEAAQRLFSICEPQE